MGLLTGEDAWYRHFGDVVKRRSNIHENARVRTEVVSANSDVVCKIRQSRAFELADQMEQGVAPGVSLSFAEPLEEPEAEGRLRVERSADRGEYCLTTTDGEPLLLAVKDATGQRFDIYVAKDGKPISAMGPVFLLLSQGAERKSWTMHSVRCERCESRGRRSCGVRELARVVHYAESVGECRALCMDVDVPACRSRGQGGCVVWCSACRSQKAADEPSIALLTSVRPQWSPTHRAMTLKFDGRCTSASAKNFQLEVSEENHEPGRVRLLFGKIGDDTFVLDYRRPFGMAQAFAVALTASHWK